MNRKVSGFSLIELVVVLAIVGILATLALPNYESQLIKNRRNDAKMALVSLALQMEQYYTLHRTYVGATSPQSLGLSTASLEGYYQLHIRDVSPKSYTLEAKPDPNGPQASDPCGSFSLTRAHQKIGHCW